MLSDEVKQFVAGFVDGDGCIVIRAPSEKQTFPPCVALSQSRDAGIPAELSYIQAFYGGTISAAAAPKRKDVRQHWKLDIVRGADALLVDLAEHAALKCRQASIAIAYNQAENRRQVFSECRDQLKEEKRVDADVIMLTNRITDAYLAGLFAADGSVGIYKGKDGCLQLKSMISSMRPAVVSCIQQVLGYGRLARGRIIFGPRDTIKFYELIRPHLVGAKVAQMELGSEFQSKQASRKRRLPTPQEQKELEEIAEKVKKMKKL